MVTTPSDNNYYILIEDIGLYTFGNNLYDDTDNFSSTSNINVVY